MTRIAMCLGLIWLSSAQVSQAADNRQALEIVDGVARLFSSQSSTATVEMKVAKADLQRTILIQLWSIGESKILVRIRQPQEDAGTAILKDGPKTWMYLPKANRTIRMPASMMMTPWMGSDFTLSDLVSQGRLSKDYTIRQSLDGLRDGVAVTDYALVPKPAAAVVWGQITLEVRKADRMPIWQRYYDEDGKLARVLSFSDYKSVNGRLIPTRLIMRPVGKTAEQTTVTYESIAFDAPISPDTFLLRNLKQEPKSNSDKAQKPRQ